MTQQGKQGKRPSASRPLGARDIALDTLRRVETDQAYSNLQLNRALQEAQLSRADAGLATELVYGTIQRQGTLDYWLGKFVAKGLDKLEPWVRQLLRMSVYQLVYLDRIPPHAAVNEAVQIAKRRGHAGIAGMVNGVLRNMLRRRNELVIPEGLAPADRMVLEYSHPKWLVERWIRAYGEETTEAMCASDNEPPHASIRVNRLRATREELLARLREQELSASPSELAPQGIVVERGGNLADTPSFRDGLWTVQDESSMLVAEAADPQPGMQVLDCCAAPGGKTTHLAEKMNDEGRVFANDLHPHKLKLIEEQAERLGLSCIRTMSGDAGELAEHFAPGSMDVVLLDAPCSGLGVIRRKPELKWNKTPKDIAAIANIQHRLLGSCSKLVRPGGVLVYSTCTVERKENEEQVERFLQDYSEFELDTQWPEAVLASLKAKGAIGDDFGGMVQLLPHQAGSDGFFIARLRRRG
ncbi:16S rRNA (cytosine(967)-C(5))-methyltransferase RsmB [Paenibacillus sp. GCM10012307]|uniref:16S rRNA (cytosine(967)-C(5))-methyltransferase n=1 Tax=Paenibacillus roseus TaxID=2798579 RepID=A0A934J9W0_9BACL|nr:16S rRNA (cytosine(967)-C(5))-methyltransferase RsmB [Paenibacillus roseus]MBJ6363306.1 16S rRNA (cytosine(967)-C(5))-methyltransferase RsmB [Paenibacillus roseus]